MPRVPQGAQGRTSAQGEAAVIRMGRARLRRTARRDPSPQWSIEELNRLLAAARQEPGDVRCIPAGRWWSALLLTLLDTGATVAEAIAIPLSSYDRRQGKLSIGLLTYELHPLTIESLNALPTTPRDELLRWPKDRGATRAGRARNHRRSVCMLCRDYKTVLFRAGLPHVTANLFDRLRVTSRADRSILNRVNVRLPYIARADKPKFPRAPRRRESRPKQPTAAKPTIARAPAGALTVLGFFQETYRPLRLPAGSPATVDKYEGVIRQLYLYRKAEVTIRELSDDLLERFLAKQIEEGIAPATVNGYRSHLLAVWQFAWKKQAADVPPRDVGRFAVPKRLPQAWSQDELQRLLDAAAATTGDVCGIPARIYFPALVSLVYDTGLRITAAISIPSRSLDAKTGWVRVDAETQKQKADQAFKLHPQTLSLLLATSPFDREFLFPCPNRQRRKYLAGMLTAILERAGLPRGGRDKFHKIRRTHATFLADAAGEAAAQKSLGHSTPSVTKAYLDPTKFRRQTVPVDLIDRPDWTAPAADAASSLRRKATS